MTFTAGDIFPWRRDRLSHEVIGFGTKMNKPFADSMLGNNAQVVSFFKAKLQSKKKRSSHPNMSYFSVFFQWSQYSTISLHRFRINFVENLATANLELVSCKDGPLRASFCEIYMDDKYPEWFHNVPDVESTNLSHLKFFFFVGFSNSLKSHNCSCMLRPRPLTRYDPRTGNLPEPGPIPPPPSLGWKEEMAGGFYFVRSHWAKQVMFFVGVGYCKSHGSRVAETLYQSVSYPFFFLWRESF